MLRAVFAATLAASFAAPAWSTEHDRPLEFSGFGTLGFVRSGERHADFTGSLVRPSGAGFSREFHHAPDTRLGVQLDVRAGNRWSAVVQVVSEQRHDGRYTPTVEWANVRYAVTPDTGIRIGRIVLPTFLVADTRKVGYANPWLRPPVELYILAPLTTNDGIDASVRFRRGEWTHTTQVTYGTSALRIPGDFTVDVNGVFGLFQTAESGALTLRAAHTRGTVRFPELNPFFDAFRAFGPAGVALADRYTLDDKLSTTATVGFRYDPGSWFATAEWGHSDARSSLAVHDAWYASAGRRFGDWTPYLTLAGIERRYETSTPGLDATGLPPPLAALAGALNAALNEGLAASVEQRTMSVGVRWDIRPRIAVKFQYDRVRVGDGALGVFSNIQPGYRRGGTVNLVGAGVDFVF